MDFAARLRALFDKVNPDGAMTYSDEEARNCLALLLILSGKTEPSLLNAELSEILTSFKQAIGAGAEQSPMELSSQAVDYIQAHPLPPELWREVQACLGSTD